MRLIISSKALASGLNTIDLDIDSVNSVRYINNYLCLYGTLKLTEVYCVCSGTISPEWRIKQENSRWDWVKKLVNQVDEQPIVLEISESSVSIIFNY